MNATYVWELYAINSLRLPSVHVPSLRLLVKPWDARGAP